MRLLVTSDETTGMGTFQDGSQQCVWPRPGHAPSLSLSLSLPPLPPAPLSPTLSSSLSHSLSLSPTYTSEPIVQAASSGLDELLSREAQEWARYRKSSIPAGSEKWIRYLEYLHGDFHTMLKTAWTSSQQKSKSDTEGLQHQLASASSRAAHAETRASQVSCP